MDHNDFVQILKLLFSDDQECITLGIELAKTFNQNVYRHADNAIVWDHYDKTLMIQKPYLYIMDKGSYVTGFQTHTSVYNYFIKNTHEY